MSVIVYAFYYEIVDGKVIVFLLLKAAMCIDGY